MMRMRTAKTTGMGLELPSPTNNVAVTGGGVAPEGNWEMRPGGMLVQKRTDGDQNKPPPTIRVRVKYGSLYHEIHISSQASFGELKKMLSGPTGLHHQDQKLLYKDKERDSNAFLDTAGVKDKSKIVLVEDPISHEKRYIEMRRNAKMEKAAKSVSEISLEVDRLAGRVSALESVTSRGGKVQEKDVINLIELLMNQLLKLDGIIADGDVKLQRKMQVRRVQKYVETLDMLKINNSIANGNGNGNANGIGEIPLQQQQSPTVQQQQRHNFSYEQVSSPVEQQQQGRHSVGHSSVPMQPLHQPSRHSSSGSVVITTQWETFDSAPAPVPVPVPVPTPAQPPAATTSTSATGSAQPRFTWDLL